MIVYNTETDPWHIRQTSAFQWFFGRYYNYQRQMSASEISQMFNMRIARTWETRGFSMSLLVNDEVNDRRFLRQSRAALQPIAPPSITTRRRSDIQPTP